MPGNIFSQGMDAFDQSYDRTETMRQQQAAKRAGRSLAGGDRQGAMQAFGDAGQVGQVRQLQADQTSEDERKHAQDLETIKQRVGVLTQVGQGLKTVALGGRRQELVKSAQLFHAAGIDTSWLDQVTEDQLTDPAIDSIIGKAQQEWEGVNLGGGAYGRFSKSSGKFEELRQPDPKYMNVPEGGKLVALGGNQSPDAGAAPTGGAGGQREPRGIRNNNPLNVTSLGGGQQWNGQTGSDGKYATFRTPEEGFAAADKNLQAYATKHGINTISGVIQRWAPAGENDPASYAATVARDLGIDPNQPIDLANPQNRQALLRSMAKVELGKPMPSGPAAAQNGAHPGEARVVAVGNPKTFAPTSTKQPKLTASALNIQKDHMDALQIASAINTRLADISTQIDKGSLNLGPVRNIFSTARNFVGQGDEQSHNYSSFRADLERLRNDSLRLNKGVQTEGDAKRAWNELLQNLNDEKNVRQRLGEIQGYNDQAIAYRRDAIDQLREDSGMPPIDTTKFLAKPSVRGPDAARSSGPTAARGGGGNIPTLSPEQAAKLPPGSQFRTTDGRVLTRK